MSRFDVDLKEIDAELRVLGDSRLLDERPVLTSFVARLRAANSPGDYRRLPADLIEVVRGLQDGGEDLRAGQKEARARIGELVGDREPNQERIRIEQNRLDEFRRSERMAQALRHAFLAVGDGIAWKILRYDRAAVTVLARGPVSRVLRAELVSRVSYGQSSRSGRRRGDSRCTTI